MGFFGADFTAAMQMIKVLELQTQKEKRDDFNCGVESFCTGSGKEEEGKGVRRTFTLAFSGKAGRR